MSSENAKRASAKIVRAVRAVLDLVEAEDSPKAEIQQELESLRVGVERLVDSCVDAEREVIVTTLSAMNEKLSVFCSELNGLIDRCKSGKRDEMH